MSNFWSMGYTLRSWSGDGFERAYSTDGLTDYDMRCYNVGRVRMGIPPHWGVTWTLQQTEEEPFCYYELWDKDGCHVYCDAQSLEERLHPRESLFFGCTFVRTDP